MIVGPVEPSSTRRRAGLIDGLARRVVRRIASELHDGVVTLSDDSGQKTFGHPGELESRIEVRDPRFYRQVLFGGSVAVADSYLSGEWDCDDLTSLVRLMLRNAKATSRLDAYASSAARLTYRVKHAFRRNSRAGSRANVRAHYDLGNDFFALWLDETLAYSSGIFRSRADRLSDASIEKFDRVCRKLDLRPDDRVLEIGSGWGGFAIHAAKTYGCRVDAATISQAQYDLARRRVAEAGVADRVRILLTDYRDLTGRYDKLASIEMIEAVGHRNFDTFFRKCDSLLTERGVCVLQAIVLPDRDFPGYVRNTDFIQRHIFPGGCLASIGALLESARRSTNLGMVQAEEFGLHYAETLRRWRERFEARVDDVRGLGYSEKFVRLWTYYLCYCEAAFEERQTGVVQIRFDKLAPNLGGAACPRRRTTQCARDERSPFRRWTSSLTGEFVELPFQWES